MENEGLIVKKHSAMIQISAKELTFTQRKLINFLIYIAQKAGDQKFYGTTVSDVKEICKLTSTENISVKNQLRKLAQFTIEFNYLDKDKNASWAITSLLASADIKPQTGEIQFEFSNFLKDKVLNPAMYAPLNLTLIGGLRSSYSIILYEFLRDYLTAPSIPQLTISDFRALMGIDEGKYQIFPNLKERVLNVAVKEINEKSDILCSYKLFKSCRNEYSHIRFFASKKTGDLTYEKTEDIKKEKTDFSMNLFDDSTDQVNKPAVQIPENIMSEIPDSRKTETVREIITVFLGKGPDYIIPNIRYSLKKSKDNFPAYLKQSLEEDYAKHDREIENKKKEKTILKNQEMAQKQKSRVNGVETLKMIEALPKNAYNKLRKLAVKELEKIDPQNPFIKRDVVIESKMIELYDRSGESEYSPRDRD